MVRIPKGWQMHPPAGTYWSPGSPGSRRLTPVPNSMYVNQITVDLGNDGMAPQATFSGAGTAQALVGPNGSGDLWSLDQCFVSTSVGQLDTAVCTVYVGPLPLANYAVMGSLNGGGSQFGMGGLGCPFGWFVYALWTGGTPGATTSFRVTGTKTTYTN
jgi:hypothetical protein